MSRERKSDWRDAVFGRRGTLLALPAVALVAFGRPNPRSIALGLPVAFAGEALRCWAVGYSGVTTRAAHVTAPQLITAGPYAYTRNPLYVGNFVTALGFTLAFTGALPPSRRVALAVTGLGTMLAVYAVIVPLEEAYLRETFGPAFRAYVARVPRIVPRFIAATPNPPQKTMSGNGRYDPGVIARAETRTFLTFGAMLAALALKALQSSGR